MVATKRNSRRATAGKGTTAAEALSKVAAVKALHKAGAMAVGLAQASQALVEVGLLFGASAGVA